MSDDDRLIANRYRLIARVGSGGMGVVWQAYDERLHRTVAVKQLMVPTDLADPQVAEIKRRAMREGRIAAKLQHRHSVTVYDVIEDDGRPYLIMEFVPSTSLSQVLARRGPLTPVEAAGIGAQAAAALASAHAAGVVHRDVKPGNVLLGDDGTVKITDFGISRVVEDVTGTVTGMIAGTPAYLAPEVAQGHYAGYPSDVYSLGATLYTAIEGEPPVDPGDNAMAQLYRVASGEVKPPTHAGPLTEVLNRLLDTDPGRRPTMVEAHEALAALAGDVPAPPIPAAGRATMSPPAAVPVPPLDAPSPQRPSPADQAAAYGASPAAHPADNAARAVDGTPYPAHGALYPADNATHTPNDAPPPANQAAHPAAHATHDGDGAPPANQAAHPAAHATRDADGAPLAANQAAHGALHPADNATRTPNGGPPPGNQVARGVLPAAHAPSPADNAARAADGSPSPGRGAALAGLGAVAAGRDGSPHDRGPTFPPNRGAVPPPAVGPDDDTPSTRLLPPTPPPPSETPEPAPHRDRRRPAFLIAAAVLVLALAGTLLTLFLNDDEDPANTAASPSSSSTAAQAPNPVQPTTREPTTTPPPVTTTTTTTTTPPSPPPPPPAAPPATTQPKPQPQPAQSPQAAITGYYALMPGNLQAGWSRLTPRYQRSPASGYNSYQGFWSGVRAVQASGVTATGSSTVEATIDYTFDDGRRVRERHRYILVQQGGTWKIDQSTVLSSSPR